MPDSLHSRAGYAQLARELGGYFHPWQRELGGPDPELTFDVVLTSLLTPQTRVLEAAYDFVPEMLERARKNAPHAQFFDWNGKTDVPDGMQGPFDLIVSRRGPTSVILRLNELAAPEARFLYVGPRLEVPQVPERLAAVNWAERVARERAGVRSYLGRLANPRRLHGPTGPPRRLGQVRHIERSASPRGEVHRAGRPIRVNFRAVAATQWAEFTRRPGVS